ncbi:twin-arginine translocation pathway signal [Mycobacterium sp. 663a-19]|uniref:twin-arginine translocation pathway signal n=1 Tax=Mycobacterium sp. 663a-19 TaxID=2986148 RepID=UPI002D1F890B|nr:twin-arginine translocation pathway signal [Mycobacterium sp. 663a-19]MEB3980062.1 twin-arginine translocation pathway signal [Mycobacterium sp. 663a-19]
MTQNEKSAPELIDEVDKQAGDIGEHTGGDEKPASRLANPRWLRLPRRKLVAILLALFFVGSAGVASWMYVYQYRPDQETNTAASDAATRAAKDGTVALLSYAQESIDKDFANAKSRLTGEFLDYYSKFTAQVVSPAAKQKGLKATAIVAQAAVSELHPDSAVVLLFVNQQTTSKDRPEPSIAASSVLVTLTKVNGNWLISKLEPV